MFFLNRPTAILNLLWTKKEFGAFSIRHLTTYDVDEEKVLVAKKIVVGDDGTITYSHITFNIQHGTVVGANISFIRVLSKI